MVAWELSRNSVLFGAAIWGPLVALFRKKKRAQSGVRSHVVDCSCAVGVLFNLILEFSYRKETVWWYPDCKVPLCVSECFKLYHTMINYLYIEEMCLAQIFFFCKFSLLFDSFLYASTGILCLYLYSN